MVIASQVLTVLMAALSRLQKTKVKSLLCLLLCNIFALITYIFLGQVAGFCLTVAAILRLLVFVLYDYFKAKPNIFVFLIFEIAFVVIAGVTWNSAIDILILISVLMTTFSTWQNSMYVLRISMVVDPILYLLYDIFIGAYITIVGDAFCLALAIFAIIYYDILKRKTSIIKRLLYYVKPKRKRQRLKARLKRK